ncbi:MAG: hypothetical protein AAFU67_09820, partial [Bacteroidota bacterium]
MKSITPVIILLISVPLVVTAQKSFTYDNFETEVLAYEAEHLPGVAEKDFRFGSMILRETKSQTERKPENFNGADYWNMMTSFLALGHEPGYQIAFSKLVNEDPKVLCEYFLHLSKSSNSTGLMRIGSSIAEVGLDCENLREEDYAKSLSASDYA